MAKLDVMIVDDEETSVDLLELLVEKLGHQVVKVCRSGLDAVNTYNYLVRNGLPRPDLVTMDLIMPEMDGISATRRILALDPAAKVIVVSAHGQADKVTDAIKSGAKYYVLKPFGPDKIKEAIRRAVGDQVAKAA